MIAKLKSQYNTNKIALDNQLNTFINSVLKSNNTAKNKSTQVYALIATYNSQVSSLLKKLQEAINKVNSFQPKTITNIKKRSALLIGCNYRGTMNELYGCINDTKNIKTLLQSHGFSIFNVLTDDTVVKPNKANILNEFKNLLVNSNSGDLLFFFYSGHGSNTLDNNNDELDGRDELIVPLDLNRIVDDELKSIINLYLKENVTLVALFDSCFSGSVLDLKYQYIDSLNNNGYTENTKTNDTLGNVIMISGCTDKQTSEDAYINKTAQGAMTYSFIQSVNTNSNISWRELVLKMREVLKKNGCSQLPQLSSGQIFDMDSKIFV